MQAKFPRDSGHFLAGQDTAHGLSAKFTAIDAHLLQVRFRKLTFLVP